ncbi:protein adenylyltransferase SelO [Halpernia sp.]|uniref:protein adenylyltransferase SelO n=1 Tax=Halpernia sp. TaxID=2782209 RepID=UPI003A910B65
MNLSKISSPFIKKFPGDFSGNTQQRQTPGVLFCTVKPVEFEHPKLIAFNEKLSEEIGLGNFEETDLGFLAGKNLPENIETYATAYAGHQFGNWAGQLGDGRAIYLGEISNVLNKKTELQYKGAGATPYSRTADGRAVLRSSVREYLMSEAIHYLGIKTTRALSLVKTGENVVRDEMYDGNPQYEKGAVIIRTAESFLRFGHFELISARKELDTLKELADFTIENYFPEIDKNKPEKYAEWFQNISEKTADLIVDWFRVGFVHGVMNTDNMSILGLTIDYGPFSFLDEYDLNFTPNTTDLPGRRYAFGNQGKMAQWNLWQLANALFPLINDEKILQEILNNFSEYFWKKHDKMLANKFGLDEILDSDLEFFTQWQSIMQDLKIDYTLFFNKLELITESSDAKFFEATFYEELSKNSRDNFNQFLKVYRERLTKNKISREESQQLMAKNNPKFILRNYLLYECISELNQDKTELFKKLRKALEQPYEEIYPEFSIKRPAKYEGIVGCSSLSCSS